MERHQVFPRCSCKPSASHSSSISSASPPPTHSLTSPYPQPHITQPTTSPLLTASHPLYPQDWTSNASMLSQALLCLLLISDTPGATQQCVEAGGAALLLDLLYNDSTWEAVPGAAAVLCSLMAQQQVLVQQVQGHVVRVIQRVRALQSHTAMSAKTKEKKERNMTISQVCMQAHTCAEVAVRFYPPPPPNLSSSTDERCSRGALGTRLSALYCVGSRWHIP